MPKIISTDDTRTSSSQEEKSAQRRPLAADSLLLILIRRSCAARRFRSSASAVKFFLVLPTDEMWFAHAGMVLSQRIEGGALINIIVDTQNGFEAPRGCCLVPRRRTPH